MDDGGSALAQTTIRRWGTDAGKPNEAMGLRVVPQNAKYLVLMPERLFRKLGPLALGKLVYAGLSAIERLLEADCSGLMTYIYWFRRGADSH